MNAKDKIEIVQGDITDMVVDAVVNAANTDLKLGSGVAGAIRNKGGPSIQNECNKIGSISLGEAAMTGAGNLQASYVIHAAGMHLGGTVSADSLRACTLNTLLTANEKNVKSLAFPAIGTGVGNFSIDDCANIMISNVVDFLLTEESSLEKIYFVLFDNEAYTVFKNVLDHRADT